MAAGNYSSFPVGNQPIDETKVAEESGDQRGTGRKSGRQQGGERRRLSAFCQWLGFSSHRSESLRAAAPSTAQRDGARARRGDRRRCTIRRRGALLRAPRRQHHPDADSRRGSAGDSAGDAAGQADRHQGRRRRTAGTVFIRRVAGTRNTCCSGGRRGWRRAAGAGIGGGQCSADPHGQRLLTSGATRSDFFFGAFGIRRAGGRRGRGAVTRSRATRRAGAPPWRWTKVPSFSKLRRRWQWRRQRLWRCGKSRWQRRHARRCGRRTSRVPARPRVRGASTVSSKPTPSWHWRRAGGRHKRRHGRSLNRRRECGCRRTRSASSAAGTTVGGSRCPSNTVAAAELPSVPPQQVLPGTRPAHVGCGRVRGAKCGWRRGWPRGGGR